ncbi:MAG: hypothetical protein AAB622_03135 [Patescibacteria group bacterium]
MRLDLYKKRTEPLILELKKDTKVGELDGERPIAQIAEDLAKLVEGMKNGN